MWNTENKSEIACCLASIILIQNNIPISELNIKTILNSAEVKIENYWPGLFSKLMKDSETVNPENVSISEEKNVVNKKKDNEKKTKEPTNDTDISKESEEDLGFGLFD
mmetsp:Transcript_7406/g.14396  ORF Transcript_7406/g.14396 Transcript_7406/m.14396 type:complete len:108 (+) Transcript_7406:1917-2240(+)